MIPLTLPLPMGNRKFAACGWECQGCLLFWFVAHSRLPDLHTHTFTHTARHSQHVNKLLNTHDGVLRRFYSLLFGVKIPTFIAVSFAYCPRHVVSVDERKGPQTEPVSLPDMAGKCC